jgi:hypothetical protein
MFKVKVLVTSVIALLCVLPFAYTQKEKTDEIIDGFKVTKVTNKTARIRTSPKGKYVAVEAGKVYKFPVTLKSNKSQIFIQFSANNTARLLPNTVIQLTSAKVKHPKLKLLTGKIALELDNFPKDHKIEVSTPTAVCGAVGTRFEVSYSGEDKQLGIDRAKTNQAQSFACTKGEIFVASKSFHIGAVKKGQAVTTQNHEGKENSYCAVALENSSNSSFEISLPDKSKYVSTSSSFEIAQPKDQKADEAIVVVKVKDDNMKTLGFFETVETGMVKGKAHVKVGDKHVQHADSEAYLAAAKEEGQLDTRIKEVEMAITMLDAEDHGIDAKTMEKKKEDLIVKRDIAAEKATKLAKRITQDRNIRQIIRQIRTNINRNQMRNIKR